MSVKDVNINIKDFIRETTFVTELEHKCIMKLYRYFQAYENKNKLKEIYLDDKKERFKNINEDVYMYNLVMECMPNGSLDTLCKNYQKQNKIVEQGFIIKIIKQLLEVLIYLESKSLMHRDIKLDNILLDKNYDIKLTDFGISAVYQQKNSKHNKGDIIISNFSKVGRIDFVAPEVYSQNYDLKVDIYDLGLSMLCLMSKTNPISQNENRKININPQLMYENYNKYLKILVLTMILEQENRPKANEAYNELEMIEVNINNPNNNYAITILNNKIKDLITKFQQQENQIQNNPQQM